MKGPFRFRLERVRALREREEQRAQQELAQAISRRGDAEAQLQAADIRLSLAHAEQRSLAAGEIVGGDLLSQQLFAERIEREREQQTQQLRQREVEVSERDAALGLAAVERQMLERLRERRRLEHERQLAARERDELDELATARFQRLDARGAS